MASLLKEMKRRNVFRVAVGYMVLAWVVLQITDLAAPALLLPEWTLSFVILMGILGFPFALFFAWAFELTPEGIKRSVDVDPQESITGQTAGSLNKVIIALLCAAVAILLADKYLDFGSLLAPPAAEVEVAAEPVPAPVEEDSKPRSIAVLPFVNMSDDSGQEYFSDGISEELLNALAQIRELRVAARTSSFAFKGQNQDITNIGEQLKVETVLEGSVRKAGPRVRISAQLISVDDGYNLWSETYDRDLTDIFAVQDEISAAIVAALRIHLQAGETLVEKQVVNIDAYNLFLQGRNNVRKRTEASLTVALRQFQQAIDIDSNYAPPWAGKALAIQLLSIDNYGKLPRNQVNEEAQTYIDAAFKLDPDLGEAHAAQALLYQNNRQQCADAIKSVDKALEKLPGEGILYSWKSFCLNGQGQYAAAREAVQKGFEVDPLHPAVQANWMVLQADKGNFDAMRNVVVEGTRGYYQAEIRIAEAQGRWADNNLLLDEAEAAQVGDLAANYRRFFEFQLGKTDQPPGTYNRQFEDAVNAVRFPEESAKRLMAVEPQDLSPEQTEVLRLALIAGGRCADLLSALGHRGLEALADFGDPIDRQGVFSEAGEYAFCLKEVGEDTRAEALAGRLLDYFDKAVAAGLRSRDWVERRALLLLILDRQKESVDALREVYELHWLPPGDFYYFDRLYGQSLSEREDYRQLYGEIEQKMNRERAKLGWPAKSLADFL